MDSVRLKILMILSTTLALLFIIVLTSPFVQSKGINYEDFDASFLSTIPRSSASNAGVWVAQDSGVSVNLHSICGSNNNYLWAAGESGVILRSTNGGSKWETQSPGAGTANLLSIDAVDRNTAWSVGMNSEGKGAIVKTSDGGVTWFQQNSGLDFGKWGWSLEGVSALDSNTAWVVGKYATVLRTTDGGNTWVDQHAGGGRYNYDVHAVDSNVVWIAGSEGYVLRTTNGGASWDSQQVFGSPDYWFESIAAVDDNTAWIGGVDLFGTGRSIIAKTTDGGKTWNTQVENCPTNVSALDANTAWAVGEGAIIKTSDGGDTWSSEVIETANVALRDSFVIDNSNAWAVGDNGAILKKRPNQYYAVIVGSRYYEDYEKEPGDRNLVLATQDVKGLRDALLSDQNNWKAENIEEVYDNAPGVGCPVRKSDILAAINRMKAKERQGDYCLFYAHMHGGNWIGKYGKTYIYTGEKGSDNRISDEELGQLFSGFDTRNIIVILDSCHSGGFLNEKEGADLNHNYFNVLAACERSENAWFWAGEKSSLFTAGVLEGCKGKADVNRNGRITTRETFDSAASFVSKRVYEYNSNRPKDDPKYPEIIMTPQYASYGNNVHTLLHTRPSTYLPEGTTRLAFNMYLCLQNPNDVGTSVNITYMMSADSGDSAGGNQVQEVTLPARTRVTVDVANEIGLEKDASIKVESQGEPVNAERPMYFNYNNSWSGGHVSSGKAKPSSTFYFAEGTTRDGFDQYLCLQNPRTEDTEATITYMLENESNLTQVVSLPAESRVTIKPLDTVGANHDVSTFIESALPIVAESPMYYLYNGTCAGGQCSSGLTSPSQVFYFPEGTTRAGFEQYVCLQNPNNEDTEAKLTYMLEGGENIEAEISLPKKSRVTVKPIEKVGPEKDLSVMVSCKLPIVAERPIYFSYHGCITGGDVSPGAPAPVWPSTTISFAEGTTRAGFDEWLCLMNPYEEDAQVTLTYMLGTGENKTQQISVPKKSRVTVEPKLTVGPDQDVSTLIESTVPIVAERPMYFDKEGWVGGHTCLGIPGL